MNDYIANIGIQLAKKFVHDSSAMTDQPSRHYIE